MYRDLEEKLELYRKSRPDKPEYAAWEEESALWGWLFSCMKFRGTPLIKGQVVSVLKGEILEDIPLEHYGFLHRYREVYRDIRSSLEMKISLTPELLDRYYGKIFQRTAAFRKNNPVVYEWSYNPPHFREVPGQMDLLFRQNARQRRSTDPLTLAADIHLRILEIYPYGEDTVTMAGVALLYALLESGLPVCHLFASEQEYNQQVAAYLKSGNGEAFREMLGRSIINRLDVLLQVCRSAEESYEV